MKAEVHNRCSDFNSYRAARVKSLFNAETGCNFDLVADLPIEDPDWRLGLIVGPSGSGKTSLGKTLWGAGAIYEPAWQSDRPIVDEIAPEGDFDAVTGALAAVGLGDVPAWLRPYGVLSNGEKFRADLARIVSEAPPRVIVDEFTSVVDRQIARFGALAFQKAWRRAGGQAILLSCHYDIIEWVEPDWVFDTASGEFARGRLWRRPKFDLEIWQTDWRYWHLFEPHHYLKMPKMIAATNYVGRIEGNLVCHLAVSTRPGLKEARACRLVVMPEWQGAGVGMRFLNRICEMWKAGENRYRKPMYTLFHTSHPGLVQALRRDPKWRQVSAMLCGGEQRALGPIDAQEQPKGQQAKRGRGLRGPFPGRARLPVRGGRSVKILVAGQKAFGAAALELVLRLGHEAVGAVSPPYASDGRRPDALRAVATREGVPWQAAGTLRAAAVPDGTDLILAAHSHDYIGAPTRRRARFGALGYHPSLLPRHRGRDAVRWTVKMGDPVAGGSCYWLSDRVDGGDIAAQAWCFVRPGDTAEALWRRELFPMGLRLIARVLKDLKSGIVLALPQDEAVATWEPALGTPPIFRPELLQLGAPGHGARVVRSAAEAADLDAR